MRRFQKDRRLVGRYKVKTPLRVRLWKSTEPELAAESVNLSQRGIFFATNSILYEGEAVEIYFDMPEEVIGEPTTEWRCTGHVVRVERTDGKFGKGKQGVGVQFDCYEISRSKPMELVACGGRPKRMISEIVP